MTVRRDETAPVQGFTGGRWNLNWQIQAACGSWISDWQVIGPYCRKIANKAG